MLVRIDEEMISDAEARMIDSGDIDIDLIKVLDAAQKIRDCGCHPMYLLDIDDGSLAVYISETYDRSRLH